jgi:hypothetical protein
MREVSPGDVVLSFVDTKIVAIAIPESHCYESPTEQFLIAFAHARPLLTSQQTFAG